MSEQTQTNEHEGYQDPLTMSDEDFAKLDPSVFEQEADSLETDEATDAEETESDESEKDTDDSEDESEDNDASEDQDEDSDNTEEDDGDDEEDSDEEDDDTESESDDSDSDDKDTEENEDSDEKKEESDAKVDYEAEYKKITAPFRANGREMQVNNADEAVKLMQMGANYNKKMAAIKPSLKTVKLLDKHGLNEESKLSHLIDLSRGDKGAIQKLLKDTGVDPMDLDAEQASDYRPDIHTVDERELELDEVLGNLQDTPTYNKTVNLVSTEWDDASRNIIANNPRVLEVLNDQMANGVYERVSTEVDRLRAFGQLTGVSDIEAYKQIGDRMAEEGAFNDLVQNNQQSAQTNTEKKSPTRRTRRKKPDAKLKQKKRAASSTKTKPASKTPTDYNPLAMSDEEFAKQFDPNLL